MSLSASEQATLNFYHWEYQYRGYYHFDTPVDIEVPYSPFKHTSYSDTPIIDDGKAPSLFKSITSLFTDQKQLPPEPETPSFPELTPRYLTFGKQAPLVAIRISFPKGTEILPIRTVEFLGMLSFSEDVLSFEIIASSETITIQIVSVYLDSGRVVSHCKAYFPTAIIKQEEVTDFGFDSKKEVAIADFGLHDEYILSISRTDSYTLDPLTSVLATMEHLHKTDVLVFQILFKGITSPLAKDIMYAVSDGKGGSFFDDVPDMPKYAKEKVAHPLFSVVMRIATQGESNLRSQYLAQELVRSISAVSQSEHNKLIPLSNEGYDYDFHYYNLNNRLSNRLGCILNAKELSTFLHYPNKTVHSQKLWQHSKKTKMLPKEAIHQKYAIGINEHNGVETNVTLSDEMRLRHTHIIGATGVGKSTLIANMMVADMDVGNGCALFDPHGDIVEDVLKRVPEHRKDDVVLIDPYDINFPIGFNILNAKTDAEKIVLSSDIVSAFKRFATSWGDNMSSVLSQAVNTFLESTRGGTLIELKSFLLEDTFRKEFLTTVTDPSIHYYWNNEYSYLKKRISPLLTRIDTFLRPKIIRYMLAQKQGIDFRKCIDEKKIVLIKLSQGLIGEDNSYLLGSLFLSKFNQVAQSRQNLSKDERHPYYVYCDEFQNFITPSISKILSGARKYGLGLILAHQETAQIDDYKTLNSVISNPYIRICFRLGDIDSKKLASGFSFFDDNDLQSLGVGEAIMRIGSSSHDCNLKTHLLNETTTDYTQHIITNVRKNYAQPKEDVEKLLALMLPTFGKKKAIMEQKQEEVIQHKEFPHPITQQQEIKEKQEVQEIKISEQEKEKIIEAEAASIEIRAHTYLQSMIKKLGQDRNYKSTTEYPTKDGGRIDVVLEQNGLKIAFEISETNKPAYEVENIKKSLKEGCIPVVMVSKNRKHLQSIQKLAEKELSKKDISLVQFIQPHEIATLLDECAVLPQQQEEVVKGFRIVTEFEDTGSTQLNTIKSRLAKIFRKKK